MVEQSVQLDAVFHALAHPARRSIIRQLMLGEKNLSELATPLDMSFAAVSKHVRVLESACLIVRRVVGRNHICRLRAEPLAAVSAYAEQFRQLWDQRFDALDAVLEDLKRDEEVCRDTDG